MATPPIYLKKNHNFKDKNWFHAHTQREKDRWRETERLTETEGDNRERCRERER